MSALLEPTPKVEVQLDLDEVEDDEQSAEQVAALGPGEEPVLGLVPPLPRSARPVQCDAVQTPVSGTSCALGPWE